MLSNFIAEKKAFALYREPGQDAYCIWQKDGTLGLLTSLPKKDTAKGFIFAPFSLSSSSHPIVFLGEGCCQQKWTEVAEKPSSSSNGVVLSSCREDFSQYTKAFSHFHSAVYSQELRKLVLSRTATYTLSQRLNLEYLFEKACLCYPHALISLFFSPQTGLWFGVSPELLLGGDGEVLHTTAIAGTVKCAHGEDLCWDEKNRKEQRIVSEYLQETLSMFGSKATISCPKTFFAGEVAHLKSDCTFSLPKGVSIWSVLDALHPTPAVCGMPKKEALDIISLHEGFDREYYSGFLGPVGKKVSLYVNLRCMKIEQDSLCLFAGGGIMPASTLESEWQETKNKMQTLLSLLNS